jgi:hypothetical protein
MKLLPLIEFELELFVRVDRAVLSEAVRLLTALFPVENGKYWCRCPSGLAPIEKSRLRPSESVTGSYMSAKRSSMDMLNLSSPSSSPSSSIGTGPTDTRAPERIEAASEMAFGRAASAIRDRVSMLSKSISSICPSRLSE